MAVTAQQKRYALYGGAGLILLYLLYRWYSGNQSSNQAASGAGITAPDTSSSDYAALAGQEQGDVAALQGALNTLTGQESSDVSGLTSGMGALGNQESADISGLTSTIGTLTDRLQNLTDLNAGLQSQIAGLAMGQTPVSPSNVASSISTRKGGAFYRYYVTVTGKAPPASVQTSNFIYQAWKGGVKASAIAPAKAHPSAPRQTNVAHPNGNHKPQNHVAHPNTAAAKTAPAPTTKATAPKKPAPPPKKPPPKTKSKPSGKRK